MLPGRPRPRRGARSLGAVQGPWRTGWDVRIDVGTVHEEPGASAGAEGEAVDLQAPGVPSLLGRGFERWRVWAWFKRTVNDKVSESLSKHE